MKIYIRSTGNVSPQKTFGDVPFLTEPVSYWGNRLSCVEPDYKEFIDVKLIRRMSRIIKMGVAAGFASLKEANVEIPDAIITGTAYGCLEDTGIFLTKMVEQHEEMLSPTAFIQSTHNTVGAQVALMMHCHNYNNTFVHRGFSFESALLDAILLLNEEKASNVLVGSVDEIINASHTLLSRFGLYKREEISNTELYSSKTKGTIAGEGAAFFLLSGKPNGNDYAELCVMTTFYKPDNEKEIEEQILSFLKAQSVNIDEIDLVITGRNGDTKHDEVYDALGDSVFKNIDAVNYKHLCGEYPTSSAFALWLAANIIKRNEIPPVIGSPKKQKIKTVLIYNNYLGIHHSLFLLSAC
ncbi:MAG: beta-ketoacyl synthase chain length factor [Bacteroidota bacterium]